MNDYTDSWPFVTSHLVKDSLRLLLIFGSALCFTVAANGDIIYENPLTTSHGGNNFNTGSYPEKAGNIAADHFELSGSVIVDTISFNAHHDPSFSQPDSIDWYLYADNGGIPGSLLAFASNSAFLASVRFSFDRYELTDYAVTTPAIPLGPGTYWAGFHIDTFVNRANPDPHWSIADVGHRVVAHSTDNGISWYTEDTPNLAFRIEGAVVPEPGTLTLAAIASATILMWKTRRRKRANTTP